MPWLLYSLPTYRRSAHRNFSQLSLVILFHNRNLGNTCQNDRAFEVKGYLNQLTRSDEELLLMIVQFYGYKIKSYLFPVIILTLGINAEVITIFPSNL